ncbi:MAG: ATP-binding protein [Bacillota bacterium]
MALERKLWRAMGKCVGDYSLIADQDYIAVGLSGGKDSLSLVKLLAWQRKRAPVRYRLAAITVDLGWGDDLGDLRDLCKELDVPHYTENTQIGPVVFQARREKNPCSLCANMRRGALTNAARRLGCNKVALAHHLDDAVETLLLNLFYQGRISCFQPSSYLSRRQLTVIRPLLYTPESFLAEFAQANGLPVLQNACPAVGQTCRQDMKELVRFLDRQVPALRQHLLRALKGLWQETPAN